MSTSNGDAAALAREVHAERLRRNFYLFIREAWNIVEPADKYRDGWHVRLLAEKLMRVARGECRRLLINVPPGTAKSIITSVMFPAWIWTWKPSHRTIAASYAEALTVRDSVRSRTLIESAWYQDTFVRGRWGFSDDMNQKAMYSNTMTGHRTSLAVGTKAAGLRGNLVVVDDPLNTSDAPSKAARDEVLYWYDQVMPSRVHDPERDAFVVIMQRVHEEDLAGHLLRQGGYEHLCLPAEYEPNHPFVCPDDPRREPGELLFPGLLTKDALADYKKRLGSSGYAGQYQQRPQAAEGGTFKYAWWRFYHPRIDLGSAPRPQGCTDVAAVKQPDTFHTIIGSVDCAFKGADTNDYVAISVWGAIGAQRYLLDMVRRKMDFSTTCRVIEEMARKWPRARKWLIEDKANGPAVVDMLGARVRGILPVNPEGGKEARAAACTPQVEAGQVFLPEGAPWVKDFVEECAAFPKSRHDDMVDTMTQALINLEMSPAALRAAMLFS